MSHYQTFVAPFLDFLAKGDDVSLEAHTIGGLTNAQSRFLVSPVGVDMVAKEQLLYLSHLLRSVARCVSAYETSVQTTLNYYVECETVIEAQKQADAEEQDALMADIFRK